MRHPYGNRINLHFIAQSLSLTSSVYDIVTALLTVKINLYYYSQVILFSLCKSTSHAPVGYSICLATKMSKGREYFVLGESTFLNVQAT